MYFPDKIKLAHIAKQDFLLKRLVKKNFKEDSL